MKIAVAFFLLFLTLCGTVCPCCIYDGCADEIARNAGGSESIPPKATCSPFFACGSCAMAVEIQPAFVIKVPAPFLFSEHKPYYAYCLEDFSDSFFQPPRIV